jgi:hypothetical protein
MQARVLRALSGLLERLFVGITVCTIRRVLSRITRILPHPLERVLRAIWGGVFSI